MGDDLAWGDDLFRDTGRTTGSLRAEKLSRVSRITRFLYSMINNVTSKILRFCLRLPSFGPRMPRGACVVLCLVEFTFDEEMNEEYRVCCGRHWKVCRKFVEKSYVVF